MDLDTSYIEPLIDDWMDHLQEIVKEQEQEQIKTIGFNIPCVAIPAPTINIAFKIANYLDLDPHIKYIAIHLYDKFTRNRFWKIYTTATNLSKASWIETCKKASKHAKLYIMSCFQLACKMDSHCVNLGISQILNLLQIIDKKSEYTRNMIFSSEMEVFKMVGYKMPLCTPLHCIEILLAATGLRETPSTINVAIDLLDLAYLKHDKLYSQFQLCYVHNYNLKTKQKLISLESSMLFLSAAIVFCTTHFISLDADASKEEIIVTKLAELSNTTSADIFNMANILLSITIQD